MSLNKYQNFKFYKFIDWIINNIKFERNLMCMLKI